MSLRDKAYVKLRDMLLHGGLKHGEMLSERMLAESFSIGRMPVREALRDLARDELIEVIPGHGAFVRQLSAEEVEELYEVRFAIEGMAAFLAALRGDKEEIKSLGEVIRQKIDCADDELDELQMAGTELHNAICRAANNRELLSMHTRLHNKIILNMRLSRQCYAVRIRESAIEHLEIIDAIVSGNPVEARSRIERHLEDSLNARARVFSLARSGDVVVPGQTDEVSR